MNNGVEQSLKAKSVDGEQVDLVQKVDQTDCEDLSLRKLMKSERIDWVWALSLGSLGNLIVIALCKILYKCVWSKTWCESKEDVSSTIDKFSSAQWSKECLLRRKNQTKCPRKTFWTSTRGPRIREFLPRTQRHLGTTQILWTKSVTPWAHNLPWDLAETPKDFRKVRKNARDLEDVWCS